MTRSMEGGLFVVVRSRFVYTCLALGVVHKNQPLSQRGGKRGDLVNAVGWREGGGRGLSVAKSIMGLRERKENRGERQID